MILAGRNSKLSFVFTEQVSPQGEFALWDLVPHHLKPLLDKLSRQHPSGIPPAQLETPMMKQFSQAKVQAPDALLFFRMGDFFELFGLDAIIASDICNLTLTSRDKSSDSPIPMAGVPVVSYKNALRKCLKAGFKVAVCDQVEDPKQTKLIVKREIVRIATPAVPGDLGDAEMEGEVAGCYLCCCVGKENNYTLASVDVSTGDFRVTGNLTSEMLVQELLTHAPKEILCAPEQLIFATKLVKDHLQSSAGVNSRASAFDSWIMRSPQEAHNLYQEFFGDTFAAFGLTKFQHALEAVAGVLSYLKDTQKNVVKNLTYISTYERRDAMLVDDASKRHLDFFSSASGERKGSLYWLLNKCFTPQGSRTLFRRMNYPFLNENKITQNLTAVEEITQQPAEQYLLEEKLRGCADIDRLMASCAQSSIEPRGVALLRDTLLRIKPLIEQLQNSFPHSSSCLNLHLPEQREPLLEALALGQYLQNILVEEPAAMLGKQGGDVVFASGYNRDLDGLVELEQNLDKLLNELEEKEKTNSGIPNLRIGFTRAFGYYFEVSKGRAAGVPKHFERKQTLTNGERFITPELKQLEEKALAASENRIHLERDLFHHLLLHIVTYSNRLKVASSFLGEVDVLVNFARLALQYGWAKPQLVSEQIIELDQVCHPVLANIAGTDPFVPNDVRFGKKNGQVLLITGPNMAGKSTLMRTIALSQLLFQIGCFVPAKRAKLGVCEHLFTRIGSGDFQLKNQSTFMVEMLETANILQSASKKSLILMDEIGRGTSTFDGLSLAWAILEDLHDRVQALTLFSTHYHEVLAVAQNRPNIIPMQMEVIEKEVKLPNAESKWEIHFTRRFVHGAAGKSYGLHVAQMAGLSPKLISRAAEVLHGMESKPKAETKQKERQRNFGDTLF